MKLRSGKELPIRHSQLPEDLDDLLETRLQNFKILFSDNPQHAKELLHIISGSYSISCHFSMREKIEEIYDNTNPKKINPLMGGAGALMTLIVNEPEYHDLIEKRIKHYDLESPLLGDVEDNNNMELS